MSFEMTPRVFCGIWKFSLIGLIAFAPMIACGSNASADKVGQDGGTIIVQPPEPKITDVTVEGSSERNVRQGYGAEPTNAATVIHVSGTFLDGVTAVFVGTYPGRIVINTERELTFTIAIPHGAPLGPQPVFITNPRGSSSFAAGVTITPITAAPSGADSSPDAGGGGATGTDQHPFRSFTKAVSMAAAGDTILLKNGTYSQLSGEVFPAATGDGTPNGVPNVPPGVTIKGESATGTKLVGSGKVYCNNPNAQVGFIPAGDARIETLDISEFCVGAFVKTGTVILKGLVVHDIGDHGVQAVGDTTLMLDATVATSNVNAALGIYSSAEATISAGYFADNANWAILSDTTGKLTITGTEFTRNAHACIRADNGPIAVSNANFHDNAAVAINLIGPYSGTNMITNSFFKNNEGGILFTGGRPTTATIKVRGSTFINSSIGLYFIGPIDLGTSINPGNNTFDTCSNHADCYAIWNGRSADAPPVSASGNVWTGIPGQQPPAGCSMLDSPSPSASQKFWHFASPGTCSSTTTGTGNVIIN